MLSYLPAEQSDADEVVALVEAAGRRAVTVPGDLSTREGNVEPGRAGGRRAWAGSTS
ncbi:hypothetical protein GCM10025868_21650 [Angustibacter aerolatus]|uniref:Uncharacterized protein n=1 Tax=Angustibacter aerolatus TaxID=1162965 RepID=A0ABQ6JI42_9ACTN|nr:hypothetical protein GCM10025868_21650 [Angustibacter aerolatus]